MTDAESLRDQIRAHFIDAAPNHDRRAFLMRQADFNRLADMADFAATVADRSTARLEQFADVARRLVRRFDDGGSMNDADVDNLIDQLRSALARLEAET